MSFPALQLRPGRPPRALVWLLLVALLLQGGAAALAQVLGRAHSHRPPAVLADAGSGWLDSLLAWRAAKLVELQAAGVFRHAPGPAEAHTHDGLERHHHAVGDHSVQALDAASDADATGASAASLLWGPAVQAHDLPAIAMADSWPPLLALRWSSAQATLPERPPRG